MSILSSHLLHTFLLPGCPFSSCPLKQTLVRSSSQSVVVYCHPTAVRISFTAKRPQGKKNPCRLKLYTKNGMRWKVSAQKNKRKKERKEKKKKTLIKADSQRSRLSESKNGKPVNRKSKAKQFDIASVCAFEVIEKT